MCQLWSREGMQERCCSAGLSPGILLQAQVRAELFDYSQTVVLPTSVQNSHRSRKYSAGFPADTSRMRSKAPGA